MVEVKVEFSFVQNPKPELFTAEIQGFAGDLQLIERLKELGLRQGLQVQYLGRGPFLGPVLLGFGATVLALRQEEVVCLRLKII